MKRTSGNKISILLCSIVIFHVICVLLGAPFTTEILHTLLMSVTLTAFTAMPFIALTDGDPASIGRIYFHPVLPKEQFLAFMGHGSIIGAWVSSGLLILDWDRPWQAWPIPCVVGCVVGALLGVLISIIYPFLPSFATSPNEPSIYRNEMFDEVKVRME